MQRFAISHNLESGSARFGLRRLLLDGLEKVLHRLGVLSAFAPVEDDLDRGIPVRSRLANGIARNGKSGMSRIP
jgi:hypothetical protein